MADAPNTSTYILVSPDTSNLPNSRVLQGGTGITLEDSGVGNPITIQPYGNIQSIFNFDTSGFMVYNSFDNTFTGVSFTGGSTINITHPNGTTGNPVFGVINDTSIQKIQAQVGAVPISTRSRLNFISGAGVSISIQDNVVNNSSDVTITASGSEPLSPNLEAIAALNPTSGSLIVGNGTTYIGIPIGPNNTVPTSNGTTWSWQPVSGGGGGTVTSITAGTGLAGGTITTTGTISIGNTSVTPGSYTSANITVNAQGQITAASNGSGGGGGTVTSITAGQNLTGGTITTSGTIALNDVVTGLTSIEVGNLTLENNSINSTGSIDIDANGSVVFGSTTGFVDNGKILPSSLSPKLYNVLSNDSVIIANSNNAPTTIVLPTSPVTGQTYKIIDGTGSASKFPIYLNATDKTINGMPEVFNFIDIANTSHQAQGIRITPNGKYMYIFNYDNTITVYKDANTSTPILLTTLTAPFTANDIAFTPDGNHLYVTNNNVVGLIYHILDASSDTPSISGSTLSVAGNPRSICVTPDGNNIYVSALGVSSSVVDIYMGASTNTPAFLKELTLVAGDVGNVIITPDGNYAYVPSIIPVGIVTAIQNASTSNPTILTTLNVGANPNFLSMTPDGNYIYVTNTQSSNITLIGRVSSNTPTVFHTIDTPFFESGPIQSIITPDGNYLYACDNASEIIMILQNASSNNPSLLKLINAGSETLVSSLTRMSPDGNYIYTRNTNAPTSDGVSVTIIQDASTNDPTVLTNILYNAQVNYTPDGNLIYLLHYNPEAPTPSDNLVTQIPASNIIPYFGPAFTSLIDTGSPYDIRTTPNGIYSYISNFSDNTVSIMQNSSVLQESSSSPSILLTLPVGNGPTFIKITPDGQNVYVLNNNDNTLSVIQNASTTRWPYFQTHPTILTTLTIGTNSIDTAITPNGNILYVGNTAIDGHIDYITNASSTSPTVNSLSITSGFSPAEVVITPNGNYAYFGIINDNSIVVLSDASTSPTVLTTLTTSYHCYYMFVTPDGNNVYALNSEDGFVTIVQNAQSGTPSVLKTLPTGALSTSMAITPNGKYGYITNHDSNNVTVIQGANTSDPTVLTTLTVAATPYICAVTPDGNYVLITHLGSGKITVIQGASTGNPSILTTLFVGSENVSINITPDGNYTYVGSLSGNKVAQIRNINNNNINIDNNFGGKQIVYNGTDWSTY